MSGGDGKILNGCRRSYPERTTERNGSVRLSADLEDRTGGNHHNRGDIR